MGSIFGGLDGFVKINQAPYNIIAATLNFNIIPTGEKIAM